MYKLKSAQTVAIDTDWIQKGMKCWIFNPLDDNVIFLKGKVLQFKPATYTLSASTVVCELEDSTRIEIPVLDVFQRNEFNAILSNLTDLQVINNPEILFQLNERFSRKQIFTFIGSNLLIINPYQPIEETFDNNAIDRFYQSILVKKLTYKDEEPHIYGLTSEVLKNISIEQEDQVMIISGESGSGKTETNKYCLKYLTNVCKKYSQGHPQVEDIEKKILNCNPLLEAFGNAKTIKNDNSSRFGKLTALKIEERQFSIKEAFIRSFFLEKSRVTLRNTNELNFHIFYYLVDGSSNDEKSKHLMKDKDGTFMTVNTFDYIKTPERFDVEKQKNELKEVVKSLQILNLKTRADEIWATLAGILHLGNMTFDESTYSDDKGGSACTVLDKDNLRRVSTLLGLEAAYLEKAILFYKRKTLHEEFHSPQNRRKCEETRDSISKVLYENIFIWLINRLNSTLSLSKSEPQKGHYYLKLLDIYGFEVFEENGFQQLAVNYTNERLHQIYIKQVFKQQKEQFLSEGVESALVNMKYADNSKVIELIDISATSIYNLVDQSCTVEIKDEGLLNNVRKAHLDTNNEYFPEVNRNLSRRAFVINHTPGPIQYNVMGFREKNRDFLREDLIELFSESTNALLNQIFKEQKMSLLENKTKRFLSQKLRQEINNLMKELEAGTHVHFVRCIKPNDNKLPFTFVPKMALNQIKYLGLLDTILLRKATYHIKMPYETFYQMYNKIDFTEANGSPKENAQRLFAKQFMGRGIDYIFGATRIFLKEDSKALIDRLHVERVNRISSNASLLMRYTVVPSVTTSFEAKKRKYLNLIILETYLSNYARESMEHRTAVVLQRWWQRRKDLHFGRKKRKGCINLQKYFRRLIHNLNLNATQTRISVIERYLSSHAIASKNHKTFQFRREVMGDVLDLIWEAAISLKLSTFQRYLRAMFVRSIQRENISLANEISRERVAKRIALVMKVYLSSVVPSTRTDKYISSTKCIQKMFRSFKIRKAFLQARRSTITIQRNWRNHRNRQLENATYYRSLFEIEIRNKEHAQNMANEVLFKSRRLRPSTVEALLSELEASKPNKMYLFYYLLDLDLVVDISIVYPDNTWVNNYYTLFKDGLQRGNQVQMVEVGETHTLVANTSRIFSWGWNDYNQLGISDRAVSPGLINTINLPSTAKAKAIRACDNYSFISFSDPPCVHYFGKIEEDKELLNIQVECTVNKKFTLTNGIIYQVVGKMCKEIPLPERATHISCGLGHVVCRTHLRRVLTWGLGDKGQLGQGDLLSREQPTLLNMESDGKVLQVSAGHSATLLLLSNHRMMWCGSNSTISRVNRPVEIELNKHSQFLWDQSHYTPVRISSSWSKTMSIQGITLAFHSGAMVPNVSLRKKVLQMLTNKWSESGCNSVLPPYIPSIAKYFTEKTMRMPNYRPDIEMESRRKLKELREAISRELNSFKIGESEGDSVDSSFCERFEDFN